MPAAIPESIKVKVIEMWLQGLSRDANAKANYISTGAVSNIVKEFEDRIGRDVTLGLRELYGLLVEMAFPWLNVSSALEL